MPVRVWLVGAPDVRDADVRAQDPSADLVVVASFRTRGARAELVLDDETPLRELVELVRAGTTDDRAARARPARPARAFEALGRLAAGVAHDLGNFVAIVELSVRALERQPLGDEAREIVAHLRETVSRTLRLTAHLTSHVRGRAPPHVVLSLTDLVTAASAVLRLALPSTIELRVEAQEDVPSIEGVSIELEQLLLNLVVNARDAVGEGGVIGIVVRGRRRGVELEVWDTGHGDRGSARSGRGAGLGLGIVRAVAGRHGATVDILGRDGGGTRVVVAFVVTAARV